MTDQATSEKKVECTAPHITFEEAAAMLQRWCVMSAKIVSQIAHDVDDNITEGNYDVIIPFDCGARIAVNIQFSAVKVPPAKDLN